MSVPAGIEDFYVHTITVETLLGTGPYGDVFAAPVTVTGFLDGVRRLVRNSTGEQVVSESTFYTTPDKSGLFTPDSRVTADGAVSRVIKVNLNDSGPPGLPDHLAVTLT